MQKITLRYAVFSALSYLLIFNTNAFLESADRDPRIEIDTGGYSFDASFALYRPSSPKKLIVNMMMSRPTHVAKLSTHQYVPIGAGQLKIHLKVPDTTTLVDILPRSTGSHKITCVDIDSVESWHPKIRKVAKRIGSAYYNRDNYKKVTDKYKKYGIVNYKQKSYQLQHPPKVPTLPKSITSLGNCKLEMTYCIRVISHERHTLPLSGHLVVCVTTQIARNAKGKKELRSEASFFTKEQLTFDPSAPIAKEAQSYPDCPSVFQFVNTKNGPVMVFSNNIDQSSIWYPSIKKVVKKSIQLYSILEQSYTRLFKKTKKAAAMQCLSRQTPLPSENKP